MYFIKKVPVWWTSGNKELKPYSDISIFVLNLLLNEKLSAKNLLILESLDDILIKGIELRLFKLEIEDNGLSV